MRCELEHAFYYRGARDDRLIVEVYVDNLIITGPSSQSIRRFKNQMSDVFKMSDLGLLTYYLGIEVKQSKEGISLSQGCYARKILEKGGMKECNSCQVPMQSKLKLKRESDSPVVDVVEYRSLVGSLRYLVHTRSDLTFAVSYVSRYMKRPHEEHLCAVRHILRFVAGTSNLGIFYPRKSEDEGELMGFTDSDLARDMDERKNTSGVLFFLGRSPVSWQSTKQRIVAQSSCEAEYIAAAAGACQAVWLARLLSEIRDMEVRVPILRIDNKSAISLIKNPVLHDRSKHIDVRFHVLREYENTGQIKVEFIRIEDQLGDILTKPLCKVNFAKISSKIGLKVVTQR
jgi:hypothetical protein